MTSLGVSANQFLPSINMLSSFSPFPLLQDPEVQRLRVLPGVQEVLAALEGKFQARVDFLAEFALERYEERHQEQLELVEALEEVRPGLLRTICDRYQKD